MSLPCLQHATTCRKDKIKTRKYVYLVVFLLEVGSVLLQSGLLPVVRFHSPHGISCRNPHFTLFQVEAAMVIT
jgi:hypothetical protein